jgi:hypothetical protein
MPFYIARQAPKVSLLTLHPYSLFYYLIIFVSIDCCLILSSAALEKDLHRNDNRNFACCRESEAASCWNCFSGSLFFNHC